MSAYKGSGNGYLAGQKYATRMAQQRRREAATAREITEAEEAYLAVRDSGDFAAVRAATDALAEIDPGNYYLS